MSINADLTTPNILLRVIDVSPVVKDPPRADLEGVCEASLPPRNLLTSPRLVILSFWLRAFQMSFKGAVALPRDPNGLISDNFFSAKLELICENKFPEEKLRPGDTIGLKAPNNNEIITVVIIVIVVV